MKVGYKIEAGLSQEVGDALWLKHPSKSRAKKPEIILYSDGLLVSHSIGDEDNQLRIMGNEESAFDSFISSVPLPSVWEKTAEFRLNIVVWIILITIWSLGGVVFNVIYGFIAKT